jgi:hypothetical protein
MFGERVEYTERGHIGFHFVDFLLDVFTFITALLAGAEDSGVACDLCRVYDGGSDGQKFCVDLVAELRWEVEEAEGHGWALGVA